MLATMAGTTIYTIGHSLHPAEHFVELLAAHAIVRLVDVRSHPASKRAPQFGKAALMAALAARRIEYTYLGRELGGRPQGAEHYRPDGSLDPERRSKADDFQAGIRQLLALARASRTVILCAEENPVSCHRKGLIAPALRRAEVEVLHIRGDGRLEPDEIEATRARQLGLFG